MQVTRKGPIEEGVLDNIPQKRYIINISARRPPLEEAAAD
jgi:hypothetical protein